jgi:ubiquinone/menaquinone biosynthesis C-methylase UbiE
MSSVTVFDQNYLQYDTWFDENAPVFEAEIRALRGLLPTGGTALEVGAGTGRFAVALGIPHAVEPSHNMARVAKSRGIAVCRALGESLPYPSEIFDSALLITVLCFVQDQGPLISECCRVTKSQGQLLIAMIDPHSQLGAIYESRKATDVFYRVASFHSIDQTISLLHNAGLEVTNCAQTIMGMPYHTPGWDETRSGFGEGAFVGLLARKLDA